MVVVQNALINGDKLYVGLSITGTGFSPTKRRLFSRLGLVKGILLYWEHLSWPISDPNKHWNTAAPTFVILLLSSQAAQDLSVVQGEPAQLGRVVEMLKSRFGLDFIYCWHGLPAYWSGVAVAEEAPGVAKYKAKLVYAKPTQVIFVQYTLVCWDPNVKRCSRHSMIPLYQTKFIREIAPKSVPMIPIKSASTDNGMVHT